MDQFFSDIGTAIYYNPFGIKVIMLRDALESKWKYLLAHSPPETEDLKKLRQKIQQVKEISYWITWRKWLEQPQQEVIDDFVRRGLSATDTANAILRWQYSESQKALSDVQRLLDIWSPPPENDDDDSDS